MPLVLGQMKSNDFEEYGPEKRGRRKRIQVGGTNYQLP